MMVKLNLNLRSSVKINIRIYICKHYKVQNRNPCGSDDRMVVGFTTFYKTPLTKCQPTYQTLFQKHWYSKLLLIGPPQQWSPLIIGHLYCRKGWLIKGETAVKDTMYTYMYKKTACTIYIFIAWTRVEVTHRA